MVVDAAGHAYVTGISQGRTSGNDFATVKYDSNGNELWAARYAHPEEYADDRPEAIALTADGRIVVTGFTR